MGFGTTDGPDGPDGFSCGRDRGSLSGFGMGLSLSDALGWYTAFPERCSGLVCGVPTERGGLGWWGTQSAALGWYTAFLQNARDWVGGGTQSVALDWLGGVRGSSEVVVAGWGAGGWDGTRGGGRWFVKCEGDAVGGAILLGLVMY